VGVGRRRRKKKGADPEVLARRAERREEERAAEARWRGHWRVVVGLGIVGLAAMLTLAGAEPGFTTSSTYREGERRTVKEELAFFVIELGAKVWVAGLRKAGISDGWIAGVAGGVVVGCVLGIGGVVWWMGRGRRGEGELMGAGGEEDGGRRREDSTC
jgi:hypothetical protein